MTALDRMPASPAPFDIGRWARGGYSAADLVEMVREHRAVQALDRKEPRQALDRLDDSPAVGA